MTKVILLNGPARCGKDTLGSAMYMSQFNYETNEKVYPKHYVHEFKFASVMQNLWRSIFDIACKEDAEFQAYTDGDKKNEEHPELGFSFRSAMIDFSEEYIKPRYGIDFFGRITALDVERLSEDFHQAEIVAVVTDSGFREEAVAMIEKFGAENVLLVKIYRSGYTFNGDSRSYINLDEFGVETKEIENITLDQFKRDGVELIAEFIQR